MSKSTQSSPKTSVSEVGIASKPPRFFKLGSDFEESDWQHLTWPWHVLGVIDGTVVGV
jgi:hypothetical protein